MTLEEELAEADAQRFLQTSARVQEEARRAIEERDIHAPAFAALLNDTNSSEWDSYSSYGPNLERTRPPGKPGDPPWLDVNRSAMLTVSRDEMDRPGTPTPTTDQQMLWTITYDTDGNQIRTPRPRPDPIDHFVDPPILIATRHSVDLVLCQEEPNAFLSASRDLQKIAPFLLLLEYHAIASNSPQLHLLLF